MTERLTYVVGLLLCVAFFVTSEPLLGVLGFIVLIVLAPWPNDRADRPTRPVDSG